MQDITLESPQMPNERLMVIHIAVPEAPKAHPFKRGNITLQQAR
jgi:hypothetical protein